MHRDGLALSRHRSLVPHVKPAITLVTRWLLLGAALAALTRGVSAQVIVVDTFDASGGTGSVRAGTSWVGNVTQNATSITVGGTAKDENGWGATGQLINAAGMTTLNLVAQRDAGSAAASLVIQFEDFALTTQIIALNASLFAVGVLTQVSIAIPAWPAGFDPARITGWSIGGGTPGLADFRMTLESFTLTAPAPSGQHSADTSRDFRISLIELTRVIELYNTRNGTVRTGCYKVDSAGEDGFNAEPTRSGTTAVTLSAYHSGDSNRDGKVSLVELTRVIELYNYRNGTVRTGAYHLQTGTEDGFAPGP